MPAPLARVLSRTAARLLNGAIFRSSCEFTAADFPVRNHKQYQQPPRLAPGDGPIGPFRRWARRFYPPPQDQDGARAGRSERSDGAGVP